MFVANEYPTHPLTNSFLMSASILSGCRLVWLVNKASWSVVTAQVGQSEDYSMMSWLIVDMDTGSSYGDAVDTHHRATAVRTSPAGIDVCRRLVLVR